MASGTAAPYPRRARKTDVCNGRRDGRKRIPAYAPASGADCDARCTDTGFEPAELDHEHRRAAALVDVLSTGRYLAGPQTEPVWRGSANQRLRLRPQTGPGRRRYREVAHAQPAVAPLLIGVPWPGTLVRFGRMLPSRGLRVAQANWRRPTSAGG